MSIRQPPRRDRRCADHSAPGHDAILLTGIVAGESSNEKSAIGKLDATTQCSSAELTSDDRTPRRLAPATTLPQIPLPRATGAVRTPPQAGLQSARPSRIQVISAMPNDDQPTLVACEEMDAEKPPFPFGLHVRRDVNLLPLVGVATQGH